MLSKYELTVEGISCIKCISRIEEKLMMESNKPKSLKINFITNKIFISIKDDANIEDYINSIKNLGYNVLDVKEIFDSNNSNVRSLCLNFTTENPSLIIDFINSNIEGIIGKVSCIQRRIMIKYDPMFVRGDLIIKKIQEFDKEFGFHVENPFEENEKINYSFYNGCEVIICVFCLIFLVLMSIIPMDYMVYPKNWGIASIMMLFTLILTGIIMKIVGFSIFKLCLKQLLKKDLNMIALISIGSGLAFIFGVIFFIIGIVKTAQGDTDNMKDYIDNSSQHLQTSAAIFTSVVTGKYIQGIIKKKVHKRILEIKTSMKADVKSIKRLVLKNKKLDIISEEELHPALIEKDDFVMVKEGLLPFDGYILKGAIKLIENAHFGWDKIESRSIGQAVMSGSNIISFERNTIIQVTEPLEKTTAGKLFFMIKDAASENQLDEKTTTFIVKFTKWFIYSILAIAVFVLIFWIIDSQINFTNLNISISYAFEKTIAVLVASCPCALGSAIPMIYVIAIRKALNNGILVKDSSALDTLNEINTIVFDKTGTITGTYNVIGARKIAQNMSEYSIWEVISIMERDHLQHPIGIALYQESLKRLNQIEKSIDLVSKTKNDENANKYFGSEGIIDTGITINGKLNCFALGNSKLMTRIGVEKTLISEIENNFELTENHEKKDEFLDQEIGSLDGCKNILNIFLARDGEVIFMVTLNLNESLKENVSSLICFLHHKQKKVHLLTGDSNFNALKTARILKIPLQYVKSEVTPLEKVEYINKLETEGGRVMMVGDGINDIKAFQASHLSCTINSKSTHNLTFSNFVIIDNDVQNIAALFRLGRISRFFKVTILIASILYNIPVTIGAGGFFNIIFGFDIPAFMAAWTMFLSSLLLTGLANLVGVFEIKKKK